MVLASMPEGWERALAIVAHPDDLEYGSAAAIARWTRQGKYVSYVLVTRGEAGIDSIPPEACGPLREAEQRRSAAIVGVADVAFLNHVDGAVEYGLALRRDIAAVLRRQRPQVVLTMNFDLVWGDSATVNHADHRAVGLATVDGVRDAANRWLWPELGEPWGGVTDLYATGTSQPTHFVDVGHTMDLAVASLAEHRAYIEGLRRAFDPDEYLRNLAGFAGMSAGCDYAVLMQRFGLG
jgi:LmbE family N-acetylglucosaminyl deacetylase